MKFWGLIFNIFLPLVFLLAPFFLPLFFISTELATLLTIIAFLFAILFGFFIATATTNYLRLQTLIANADASLINLFNLVQLIQPKALPKLAEQIDQYVIATLDYELKEFVDKTDSEMSALIKYVNQIKPQDSKGLALFSFLHETKAAMQMALEEIPLVARPIVSFRHWLVLIILALLVCVFILALRDETWVMDMISGLLSFTVYSLLLLIYMVDQNSFAEARLSYENSQNIFSVIGRLKYYPSHALDSERVHIPEGPYRVGVYKDYPRSTKKVIRVVHAKS